MDADPSLCRYIKLSENIFKQSAFALPCGEQFLTSLIQFNFN